LNAIFAGRARYGPRGEVTLIPNAASFTDTSARTPGAFVVDSARTVLTVDVAVAARGEAPP
jgi:hypothetical protein